MKASLKIAMVLFFIAIINAQNSTFNCSEATEQFCGSGVCSGHIYTNNVCVDAPDGCLENHVFLNSSSECVDCTALGSANCSTTCTDFMHDGSNCVSCEKTYGIGCNQCSSTACTACRTGLSLSTDKSHCISSSCVVSDCISCFFNLNRCQLCRVGFELNFTSHDCQSATCNIPNCLSCNSTKCSLCSADYTISSDEQSCLPVCESLQCTRCVSPGKCAACSSGWILNARTFTCAKDCSNISIANCHLCNDNHICLGCQPNYALILQGVFCTPAGCAKNCMKCSSDNSSCQICKAGTSLKGGNGTVTTCQDDVCHVEYCKQCLQEEGKGCKECYEGFTLSADNKTCEPLCAGTTPNCLICDNMTCEVCRAGFKIKTVTITTNDCTNSTTSSNCTGPPITTTTVSCQAICNIPDCLYCLSSTQCADCAGELTLLDNDSACVRVCSVFNCITCSSATNVCDQCRKNFMPQRNGEICVQTIPDGSAQVVDHLSVARIVTCDSLYAKCAECDGSKCFTCEDQHVVSLDGKSCVACSAIVTNCFRCTIFSCLQCAFPFQISGNKCVNCALANCQQCSEDLTACETCESGYKSVQGACVLNLVCTGGSIFQKGVCICPTGLYWDGVACVSCTDTNCIACSSSACIACINGFYPSGNTCLACSENCQVCSPNKLCTTCAFPFSNINGACRQLGGGSTGCVVPGQTSEVILRCPVGCSSCQFHNDTLICMVPMEGFVLFRGAISRCDPSCQTCAPQDRTICRSCYRRFSLSSGRCLRCSGFQARTCRLRNRNYTTSCLIGFTVVSTPGVCTACAQNCARCFRNGAGKCDPGKCLNGYVYNQNEQSCSSCFNNCPVCDPNDLSVCISCGSNRYKDAAGACQPCPTQCKQCSGLTTCSDCQTGFALVGTKCIGNPDYPLTYINGSLTCFFGFTFASDACTFAASCNTTASCLGCPYGFFLDEKICYPCTRASGCKSCRNNGTNNCDICNDAFYLSDGACVACKSGCSLCSNQQNCLRPASGFYIVVDAESNPTGQCIACTSPCLSCIRQPTFCTSCVDGFTIQGSSCFSNKLCNVKVVYVPRFFVSTHSVATRHNVLYRNFFHLNRAFCASLPRWARLFGCARSIRMRRCRYGSLQIDSDIDASSAPDGSSAVADIQSSLATNGIDGLPILSSTATSNGFTAQESKTNLGLILGVSIPLGLILILIIFLMVRAQKKTDQQPVQSWQNIDYAETDQKVAGQL